MRDYYVTRGDFMATKSILKNVQINKKDMAKSLVSALDNAEKKSSKDVILNRALDEVKGKDIKVLFGDSK